MNHYKNVLLAGLIGFALVIASFLVATATGEELSVTTPALNGPLPLGAFAAVSMISISGALIATWVSLMTKNPRRLAMLLGFLVLGAMAVTPLTGSDNWTTIAWLQLMHFLLALPVLVAFSRFPATKS
jgi:peptidoglycan/LPS O-acetylase OafA/YrhL